VIIRTTADPSTVNEFINACQLAEYAITVQNALGLLGLAEEWEVPQLEEAVIEFVSRPENALCLLMPSLCQALSREADTSRLEQELPRHLSEFLEGDSLFQLPLSILARIIGSKIESGMDLRSLFRFLVRCLDHFGPSASVLFSGISVNLLTTGEIETSFTFAVPPLLP
jgi:hypothetical protein